MIDSRLKAGRQAGPHSSPHKSAAVERERGTHRLEVGASEAGLGGELWLSHQNWFLSCSCGLRWWLGVGFGVAGCVNEWDLGSGHGNCLLRITAAEAQATPLPAP